ncbi:MAG: hypothetical protein P1P60_00230 [Treponema phagedenis]|uniref:hypothetical protein n=1 Tax=Treponema phagedenis TaxID=162 RepID=UPI003133E054
MPNFEITLDNALFTYILHSKKNENLSNHIFIKSYNLYLSYSKKTEVISYETDENAVYIIGLCVDSHGELTRYDIPKFLLSLKDINIDIITNASARFAGNYVILLVLNGHLYAFNDATGIVSIYYCTDTICLSSFDNITAKTVKAIIDEKYYNIRFESDHDAAMPNDITVYKNIKLVLPNHYLDLNTLNVKRFYPIETLTYFDEPEKILEKQIPKLQNIIKEYARYTNIVCPLTAGWDSRVVFAFLLKTLEKIETYTFFHKNFTDMTADLLIPKAMTDGMRCSYSQVPDMEPESDFYEAILDIIGPYYYKSDMAMAYTHKKQFGELAVVNSSIIDLLGKNSKTVFLPVFCASPKYFVTKLRNASKYTDGEMKKYLSPIYNSALKKFVYDLFGWEILCGRYLAYSHAIYAAAGIVLLDFFNCREILNDWIQIKRVHRKRHIIHKFFLSKLAPDLLKFPVNPDTKFKTLRESRILYFFATYLRFFIRKLKKLHIKKNEFMI